MELAERLDRFWAALIDRLVLIPIGIFAAITIPLFKNNGGFLYVIVVAAVLLVVLMGAQFWLLTTRGQTIGKKALGLRIVLVKDLTNGGFVVNVLLRAGVPWLIALIPGAGLLFGLIDPLFIFKDDRLCLHDRIAGTCVIKA